MQEEGLRIVNFFSQGRKKTVHVEYTPALTAPPHAVIRVEHARSGVSVCKEGVEGVLRVMSDLPAS